MTVVAVISKTFLFFMEISASDSHDSHFLKRVRGGQNLYGLFPVERAWGHVCKKGEIKRVIKGSDLSATGKEVTNAHKIK